MPPNSRYDRIDKHCTCKQSPTKSDLQVKKNCKFRNVQSNEMRNGIKSSANSDLNNFRTNEFGRQSIDRRKCSRQWDPIEEGRSLLKNLELKSVNCELRRSTAAIVSKMIKVLNVLKALPKERKFMNTCSATSTAANQFLRFLKASFEFTSKSSDRTCYAFVILVSILVYLPSLNNEFVFDDVPAILHNKIVQEQTPFTNLIQLFTTDYWGSEIYKEGSHKSYRPFTTFTFRLNFWFNKLDPFGYQLINIILHCLISLLNYRFISYFLKKESSFIAAVLFAVHPIHVDAVSSIVGRAELLSALFVLIIFNLRLTIRKPLNLFLLFVLTIFGLLSKEQAITVLPLIMIYETLFNNEAVCRSKSNDKSDKGKNKTNFLTRISMQFINYSSLFKCMFSSTFNCKVLTMMICVLFVRCRLLHDLPKFSRFDNPLNSLTGSSRLVNLVYIWLFNLYKFINPYSLACDWSAQSIRLVDSVAVSIAVIFAFALILIYIHRTIVLNDIKLLFFVSFSIITFLPSSNLFFSVGFLFAERVLYLPSLGLCAIVGYACQHLQSLNNKKKNRLKFNRNAIRMVVIVICCLNAYRTWSRTFDWHSEQTLFEKDLQTNSKNVKLLNNLGRLYEKQGDHNKAFKYYLEAIEVEPEDARGALNCANLHSKIGNNVEAESYYKQAIRTMPGLTNLNGDKDKGLSFFNKFKTSLNDNDDLSKTMFNKNTHHNHFKQTDTLEYMVSTMQLRAALNLANLLSNNRLKTFEANRLYEQLIAIKPNYGDTYFQWIESILKSNSSDLRSIKHVLVQLLHNSKHLDVNVLYNVAVLISNSGNSMVALELFDQILKLNPKHEESLVTSARIIRKNSEFNQLHKVAIERLEKFISLNQLDYNVFFELGMLYINFNTQKSIEYLQKAIAIKPDLTEALFNLSLLLYRQHRAEEAIPFLELLLKHESHQKAMILLFSINSSKEN